jgi:hypothetical protein
MTTSLSAKRIALLLVCAVFAYWLYWSSSVWEKGSTAATEWWFWEPSIAANSEDAKALTYVLYTRQSWRPVRQTVVGLRGSVCSDQAATQRLKQLAAARSRLTTFEVWSMQCSL